MSNSNQDYFQISLSPNLAQQLNFRPGKMQLRAQISFTNSYSEAFDCLTIFKLKSQTLLHTEAKVVLYTHTTAFYLF